MNHRERVLAALSHKQPDRVPVDMGGMASTGIMAVAYDKFRRFMGLPTGKLRIIDIGQQLAEIEEDMLELYGADVLCARRTLPPTAAAGLKLRDFPLMDLSQTPPRPMEADIIESGLRIERVDDGLAILDGKGRVMAKKPDTSYYFDPVHFPLAGATTLAEIAANKWPLPPKSYFTRLRKQFLKLRQTTDYALMDTFGGNIHEQGQNLRGWGQFLMDLTYGGAFTDYLLDYIADHWMEQLGLYMEAVGDLVDVVVFGDDLGTQAGTQMAPDIYRRTIHPRHKRLYSFVREHYPNVHVFLHSCGAIADLIPMLIDEGVQVLNPVQTSATGMDPRQLKREFGRDLTFWGGGIDTQSVLPYGTPEDVRRMVLERMEIFGEGGGFVFCQVHNIQASIPPENILAMMQATREFNGLAPIETGRIPAGVRQS